MNKDEREYYGIKFNGKIPKKHKVNEFSKEVEITFLGQAYLIERKDDDKVEKIKIDNYYKLKKEGKYEIEFVDKQNFIYNLQLEIHKPFLFFILIFLIGLLLLSLLLKPSKIDQSPIQKLFSVLNFSVLDLDITDIEEPNIKYVFEVGFDNIVSKDMDLSNSMNAKSIAKNKIAPGVSGEFSIIISTKESNVDMTYSIDFQDLTKDKPNNLLFKIRGQSKEFNSLQQLEKYLKGTIKKDTQKEIIIDWRWPYEIDNAQDTIDTDDGIKLQNYQFKINVFGEEVI